LKYYPNTKQVVLSL